MTSTTEAPLAIDGGTPVRSSPFPDRPLPPPATDADPIATLEAEFATFLAIDGVEAVTCRDAASAYALALEAFNVTEGEAILPALDSATAAAAAHAAGLTIVPAEVEADSINLGPRGLARALSDRTSVVIASHAFGHPFAAGELARVLQPAGVPLIEDASAALGGGYRGQQVGLLGDLALFAFGEPHLVSSGGALLASTDPGLAARLRDARDRTRSAIEEDDACFALAALRAADEELTVRRQLAWELTFDLRGRKALSGMAHSRWIVHAYDRYAARVRGLLWKRPIEESVAALRAEGIPCEAALAPSLHLDPDIRAALSEDDARLEDDGFPVARRVPAELIALPLHGGMTDRDIADIALALAKLEAAST